MMKTDVSFEFFPAKTETGKRNLSNTIDSLKKLNPKYMSVTYGAGGTDQIGTFDTITEIQSKGINACPHLTCVETNRAKIKSELNKYKNIGINKLVALRGDLPDRNSTQGDFNHANELITFVRDEFGDYFNISVAAYPEKHPESVDFYSDFTNFKCKIVAGADNAITQYFFNPDAYYRFIDECQKQQITAPIIPGIMPIINYQQLANFSKNCGAEIPRWLATRLQSFDDDLASLQDFGVEIVSQLCQDLIGFGVNELHFYSMNKATPCQKIIGNI